MLSNIVLQFVIYSFLGWLMESCYESILSGHWINRGFLTGPICPIYGFGLLAVLFLQDSLRLPWYLLLPACIAVTSMLEYFTGWLLETLFHHRWWDYSQYPLHIKGRICLPISLIWGILCLGFVYIVAPFIRHLLGLIPAAVATPLAIVLVILILIDNIISIAAVIHLNNLLAQLHQMTQNMRQKSAQVADNWQKRLRMLTSGLREWRQLANRTTHVQRRLLRAFPALRSLRHPDTLHRLRRWLHLHQRSLRFPDADLILLRNLLANRQPGLHRQPDRKRHASEQQADSKRTIGK